MPVIRPTRAAWWAAGLALALGVAGALAYQAASHSRRELRVCADPNNLPFSNERRQGFENRLAELLADELDAELHYTWWAQRRGFVRNTLDAGTCDVLMGVPSELERVLTSVPYYRSTYVFVSRERDELNITSLDDPRLKAVRVGVHLIGDDYTNTPPAHALGSRGIVANVVGFPIYGNYAEPNPPARIVEAVAKGTIDVAIVWGPFAGYFSPRQAVPLRVVPVAPERDGPELPFVFDIALGVRRGDEALRHELDAALARRRAEIAQLLAGYGVPRPPAQSR